MKRRHLAMYFLLLITAGFCVGRIYSLNILSMEALGREFSGLVSASASLFTAWIALSALNSWRIQEKYKKEIELFMLAFELLSELKCCSKIYARELIYITHKNRDVELYIKNTQPFSEHLKEYARVYARIEFLGLFPSMPKFVSADALNTKINKIISDENRKEERVVAQLVKQASDNIDSYFDEIFTALKKNSPIDKIKRG